MTLIKKRILQLRTAAVIVALVGTAFCLTPAVVAYAADGGSRDAKVTAPAAAPTTTAPAPAAPTAAPTVAPTAPAPAPTTSTNTQSWWQAALVPVLSVLGLFVAGFLVGGLRKLVQLIEKKWNIDIPDSVEKMMYDKAKWALAWAEEQAEKRLLHGDGQKTPGAEKLTSVIDMLKQFADKMGYGDEWQKEKIEKLVEGVLHLERDAGNGAIGSNGSPRGDKLVAKANGNS